MPKEIYSYTVESSATMGVLVDECLSDVQVVSLVEDEGSVRLGVDGTNHRGSAPACEGTPIDVTLSAPARGSTVVDDLTAEQVSRQG